MHWTNGRLALALLLSVIVLAYIASQEEKRLRAPESKAEKQVPQASNKSSNGDELKVKKPMHMERAVPAPPLIGQNSKQQTTPSLEKQVQENAHPPLIRRYGYYNDNITSASPAPYQSSTMPYDACGNTLACSPDRSRYSGSLLKDVVELKKIEPDFYEQQLRIPAPITTRRNVHTRQVGTLTGDGAGTILSLYGKPLYGGSTRWQYYAVHANDKTRHSVMDDTNTSASTEFGVNEILTSDAVTVPSVNDESYTAEIYTVNDIRYTDAGSC